MIYYNIIIIISFHELMHNRTKLNARDNHVRYLAYMSAQLPPMNVITLYLSSRTVRS
jgi:hypothetical protein